jgi:hypothetical protein
MFDEDYGLPTLPHESSDYGVASLANPSPVNTLVYDAQRNLWFADFASGKISLQKTYKGESSKLSTSMTSSAGKNYLRNLLDVSGNEKKLLDAAKSAAQDPGTNTAVAAKRALTDAIDMKNAGVSGSTGLTPADVKDPKVALTDQPWFLPAVVGGSALVLLGVGVFVYRRYR